MNSWRENSRNTLVYVKSSAVPEEQDPAEEWKKVALAILYGLREEGPRAEVALVNDPTRSQETAKCKSSNAVLSCSFH